MSTVKTQAEKNRKQKDSDSKEEFVKIRKRDLERLTTEVMQVRDLLPRILSGNLFESLLKLSSAESTIYMNGRMIEQLKHDCDHLQSRLEVAKAECHGEREEKQVFRDQLGEARVQLQQQSEYCNQMGSTVCTLLWGATRNVEAVKNILSGREAERFFNVAGQTLDTFVKSLHADIRPEQHDETQFVLALAGIITNIAAVTRGRDLLSSSSQVLLDTLMKLLEEIRPGICTELKALLLKSLYNVSINVKGLKYISERPGFIRLLWCHLQDSDPEVCMLVLCLLQSVVQEPEVLSRVIPELKETLPLLRIMELAESRNHELRKVAAELLDDLKTLGVEVNESEC
ncbi:heat shock factor 2-binding protein [Acipenser oxyrinchus oxyrinchus]|uniref:Heat shock factor 2-binding protein n=1 Tax=Acipenser oxyrinchus oxyrinchus TaxID=40147 RepID=A0AAD8DG37_ACIOX|nr:heat shock factor 2-binding protein [Acipenser oxyrinchus oxyrinchus]